ncbi:MAG: glucuronate isomerase [Bacteroidales bacterium]|nr:glucuronate isomerase [Bacteroidales bacterium]
MKPFLDENFLLQTKTAEDLFHNFSEKLPIIDYHCHLPVEDIARNRTFTNITEAWLKGDHYKWRAMRANGIPEEYCTGKTSTDLEKFKKWAETVPYTLRNPLYHWTHLELKRYFGIEELLNSDSAEKVFNETNEKLQEANYSCRGLLKKMNVEVVCTTDDPVDSLEFHKQLKDDNFEIKVLPAFRPDKAMAVENTKSYNEYLNRLSEASDIDISSFSDLLQALRNRHDYFANQGCCVSDHGIESFYAANYSEDEIRNIFGKIRNNNDLTKEEVLKFKSAMLFEFGIMDNEKNWVQQYHYGALRNNNSRMYHLLGPDTGFDSIADGSSALAMSSHLNKLASERKLTKTIIYNLNPADNEVVATMIGNFQDGFIPGKLQYGSGWWFLDQKDGMEKQINTLSNLGLLSRFVGMLTDSRSFLSFPRHEYFRRILCNLIGYDVENGMLPHDINLLGELVSNISYYNAKNYFDF